MNEVNKLEKSEGKTLKSRIAQSIHNFNARIANSSIYLTLIKLIPSIFGSMLFIIALTLPLISNPGQSPIIYTICVISTVINFIILLGMMWIVISEFTMQYLKEIGTIDYDEKIWDYHTK